MNWKNLNHKQTRHDRIPIHQPILINDCRPKDVKGKSQASCLWILQEPFILIEILTTIISVTFVKHRRSLQFLASKSLNFCCGSLFFIIYSMFDHELCVHVLSWAKSNENWMNWKKFLSRSRSSCTGYFVKLDFLV